MPLPHLLQNGLPSRFMRFKFFCDKLSGWIAFGVTLNWDDGVYFGVYIAKWLIGIQGYTKKQAVVMPEDLIKIDYNHGRKGENARYTN
jgi:hypothetical protein